MVRDCSAKRLLGVGLAAGLFTLLGCQPTPDYRVTLHDIPADATVLLIGWKGDDDTVSKTSLAVPVADFTAEQRATYVLGVDLGEVVQEGGVLSLATIDKKGCMSSVVSADPAPRSSSTRVTQLELSLDPKQNPNVVTAAVVRSPPVMCPMQAPYPEYPEQVACQKLPGLVGVPTEPTLVPTRPVVIQVLRQLRGPARVFDGGKLSFFGWGLDRAALTFGPACDPNKCFLTLGMDYPQFAAQLAVPMSFRYPTLTLVSYSQIDLEVLKLKAAINVAPNSSFQDRVVQCIAGSAASFVLTNPNGAQASFVEPLTPL